MAKTDLTKLYVRAAAGSVTGSIQRVCAADESNASTIDNWVTGNFKSLQYGPESSGSISGEPAAHTGSQNDVHQIGTQDIDILASKCVDGPFIAINVSAGSGVLYYNGDLAVTGS